MQKMRAMTAAQQASILRFVRRVNVLSLSVDIIYIFDSLLGLDLLAGDLAIEDLAS